MLLHSREKAAVCCIFWSYVYSCVPLVSWQIHPLSNKAFWTFHIVLCFEATDVCDKQMVMALNLNIFKYFVVYILWGGMYSLTMQNWSIKWKVSMSGCLMSLPSLQTNKPYVFQDYLLWDIFTPLPSLCFQGTNQLWNALYVSWAQSKRTSNKKSQRSCPTCELHSHSNEYCEQAEILLLQKFPEEIMCCLWK